MHFSVGLLQVKPGYPVRAMAEAAEEALMLAKQHKNPQDEVIKNAISIYGQVVGWADYEALLKLVIVWIRCVKNIVFRPVLPIGFLSSS